MFGVDDLARKPSFAPLASEAPDPTCLHESHARSTSHHWDRMVGQDPAEHAEIVDRQVHSSPKIMECSEVGVPERSPECHHDGGHVESSRVRYVSHHDPASDSENELGDGRRPQRGPAPPSD